MCLIIDANFVHRVYPTPDPDGLPVQRSLTAGSARLVYGGSRLSQEYRNCSAEFRRWVVRLDQAGRARKVSDERVDQIEHELAQARACVSDDPHIIALAQVSGVRLLCSNDALLHVDFTNRDLINTPRGHVYQSAGHARLIDLHCAHLAPGAQRERRARSLGRRGRRPGSR